MVNTNLSTRNGSARRFQTSFERVRQGTVIHSSRPAVQIVPVNDAGDEPIALADDLLYRAIPVGLSSDGHSSADHDAVLSPR
jgi:hypothetical protein